MDKTESQGTLDDLRSMTVGQLLDRAKAQGAHAPKQGWGDLHVVEDEYGRTAIAICVAIGPYADDLVEFHDIGAPGVRFVAADRVDRQGVGHEQD